jgi:hypothetical protein
MLIVIVISCQLLLNALAVVLMKMWIISLFPAPVLKSSGLLFSLLIKTYLA